MHHKIYNAKGAKKNCITPRHVVCSFTLERTEWNETAVCTQNRYTLVFVESGTRSHKTPNAASDTTIKN